MDSKIRGVPKVRNASLLSYSLYRFVNRYFHLEANVELTLLCTILQRALRRAAQGPKVDYIDTPIAQEKKIIMDSEIRGAYQKFVTLHYYAIRCIGLSIDIFIWEPM